MAAQIDKILKLVEEGKVTAQIVPFGAGAIAARDSDFVLLELGDAVLSPVVFVEGLQDNQIFERQAEVDRYREAIGRLRDPALTPRESRARLSEMRESYVAASG